MNKNDEIELANFLINKRGETWSIENEQKAIQDVRKSEHMHDIWRSMAGMDDIKVSEIDELNLSPAASSVCKIQAGLRGETKTPVKTLKFKMTGNTKLEEQRMGIRNIAQALQENPLT